MKMRRNYPMAQGKDRLDYTCNTCCSFAMTDVRLHRPDQKWTIRVASFCEHPTQGLHLNGITERSSCSVGFNVPDLMWLNAGIAKRGSDHRLL
jgi:hypothetical protein